MILLYIVPVVFLVLLIVSYNKWGAFKDGFILGIIQLVFTFFGSCLIGVLLSFLVSCFYYTDEHVDDVRYIVKLEALGDGFATEGSFFIGSGNIEGVSYYHYYYRTPTGFKHGKVKTRNVEIRYSDGQPVKVIMKREFKEGTWQDKWLLDSGSETVFFEIPRGSITAGYNLDLK